MQIVRMCSKVHQRRIKVKFPSLENKPAVSIAEYGRTE